MIISQATSPQGEHLTQQRICETLQRALEDQFTRQKVLVLIPDHSRSLPLPLLFPLLVRHLQAASRLDFMVALGTHPALSNEALIHQLGITAAERETTYQHVGLLNHDWQDQGALVSLGVMQQDEVKAISGDHWHPSMPDRIDILINKAVLNYDRIIILGPTFPHEVVGFSGGAKYLFPGISGPDMINATHWLGALGGAVHTIGIKDTPVRRMIHAAAGRLHTPITLIAVTVDHDHLVDLFVGDLVEAWCAAADSSARLHIHWCDRPYTRVLSCAQTRYDELWTAAKAMYKLEPATATGGEVIIFAPHLEVVSQVHGAHITQIGYHILPYFLSNWEYFTHIPLAVLAHSTHLRGSGIMENGVEKPNLTVTLASRIPEEECRRLNLGYLDPGEINIADWIGRENEGILCVPEAGELLYKTRIDH